MRRSRFRAGTSVVIIAAGCGRAQAPDDDVRAIRPPEIARVVAADEAVARAHVPTLDPAPLDVAEIEATIGPGARCEFRYTTGGEPVLGLSANPNEPLAAVVKLSGHLVVLGPTSTPSDAAHRVALAAEPVRITVEPDVPGPANEAWRSDATMIFEVSRQLRVGYRGSYDCVPARSR
jgi:hypothetical protein